MSKKLRKYNVHLMTPYASRENVAAEDEQAAIAQCFFPYGPDALDDPTSFLVVEILTVAEGEECPYCGEDRVDWLIWTPAMEVECQSCKKVYHPADNVKGDQDDKI